MSKKQKLSDLVATKIREPRPVAPVRTPDPAIPAVDAVQRSNTAIQKTLKFKEIDPTKCRPWIHHNRRRVWLTQQACASLIESIRNEGQQELGLVREVRGEEGVDYEIIFGMRRWYAASQIEGAKFKARVTDADDRECARLMHIENEESENISQFEKALSFEELINAQVFQTQTELADSLRVKKPYISKLLRAARLFAYADIKELLEPHTRELSLQKAIDLVVMLEDESAQPKVLGKAKALRKEQGSSLPQILSEFRKAATEQHKPEPLETVHFRHGKRNLLVTVRKPNGKALLSLEPDFKEKAGDRAEQLLTEAVQSLLAAEPGS
jgi:ParB family chromosome partitioning protein